MSKRRGCLIWLLLIIAIICCSTHTSLGQEEDTLNISYPSSLPAKSEVSHEDILNHAQSSLDRSISILNTVATLMGVLVGLLTLIVVIGIAWGFFEHRRWQEYGEQAKESAYEAKKAAEEAKPIIERLKKTEKEMDKLREEIKQFPSLSEPLSEDQKEIFDKYGRKIEAFEAFGIPLESEDYHNQGNNFYRNGKYILALKDYDKAIELKPDYEETWNNKGAALDELGRYNEALKAFDKAIELKPDYGEAWCNIGVTLSKLGRYEEALKAILKAIELKPEDGAMWYNIACVYSLKGDKENALENLHKATHLDKKFKTKAKLDADFKNLWNNQDFKKIVS